MAYRLIKVAILVSLGLFLYTRIVGDTVLFYINERFVTLTLLAAVGLILVGATQLFRPTGRENHEAHEGDYENDHDHAPGEEHDHDHQHEVGRFAWLGLLILTIPVVVGFLVPPQPLGANALENREVNVGDLASIAPPSSNETRMGVIGGERNIVDWLRAFQSEPDPAAFQGQEAHVIGFVYRDERFAEDTFMVGRFIVSCCVADAAPVGLIVRTQQAGDLESNQWIDVSGHFEAGEFDGFETPVLVADEIVLTEPPPQPYLYP